MAETATKPAEGQKTAPQPPDFKSMSRRQLDDAIKSYARTCESLIEVGGPDLDGLSKDQTEELNRKLDWRDSAEVELKSRPDPNAIKSRFDAGVKAHGVHDVKRPHLGGQDSPGDGRSVEVGDRIDNGESRLDKFMQMGPFKSIGHYLHEIRKNGQSSPGEADRGALGEWNHGVKDMDAAVKSLGPDSKAATGMSEFSDPDGASFVPIQISQGIWERSFNDINLLALVEQIPVAGNNLSITAFEDSSKANGLVYGGMAAYWTNEADQYTKSKPQTRKVDLKLNKLTVLTPVTEELQEDAVALESRIMRGASRAFSLKINDAILNGTGSGQPLGILNSGAKIVVAANSGQGAGTVIAENIDKMYARRAAATTDWVWLYNITAEPQFAKANYSSGNAAQWLWVPAGGMAGRNTYDMIRGQRAIECEFCNDLGTEGDVILWSPSSYVAIVKSSGINSAVSMHVRFDYGEVLYKWYFRMDGRPMWETPATPAKGSTTRSPIVTLNSSRT